MKKFIITSLFIAFFLLTEDGQLMAQENESQITIDITREVDGQTESFSKTYTSREEMEADEKLQAFSKELDQINHVAVTPGGKQIVKIHTTDSSSSYSLDLDTDVKSITSKEDPDVDSKAAIIQKNIYKLEEALANLGVNIKEEIEVLGDMDWDEIKERHKIMIIDEEEETDESLLEDDEINKTMTISTVEDSEWGKRGRVSNKDMLEVEILDYYPNPSKGRFRLKFQVAENAPLFVKVYNIDDQEVFMRYFPRFTGVYSELIDMRGQDTGTYLLEISHGKKRLVRKMMIE